MLNMITRNTAPVTYTLKANDDVAWIDADRDGQVNEQNDSCIILESNQGPGYLVYSDLKAALSELGADKSAVDEKAVMRQLEKQYDGIEIESTTIKSDPYNFEGLSTYRNKQSFQLEGDEITYTLQFDPEAPLADYTGNDLPPGGKVEAWNGNGGALVRGTDGLLSWGFGSTPSAPEPPANAVKETTLVERDGLLHWVFPGEALLESDKFIGSGDNAGESLLNRHN